MSMISAGSNAVATKQRSRGEEDPPEDVIERRDEEETTHNNAAVTIQSRRQRRSASILRGTALSFAIVLLMILLSNTTVKPSLKGSIMAQKEQTVALRKPVIGASGLLHAGEGQHATGITTTQKNSPKVNDALDNEQKLYLKKAGDRAREAVKVSLARETQANLDRNLSSEPRPKAFIHVGPRKTGTTSIQLAIQKLSGELTEADIVPILPNKVHYFSHCIFYRNIPPKFIEKCKRKVDVLEEAVVTVRDALKEGKSVIVSSESMDPTQQVIDYDKLKTYFEGFDIHIILTYRRYHEWAASQFSHQYAKVEGYASWDISHQSNNLVDFASNKTRVSYERHYTAEVFRAYTDAGFRTHILNYHDTNSVVATFFCFELLEVPQLCEHFTKGVLAPARANVHGETMYDEIVVAAYNEGLIKGDQISRMEAIAAVQTFVESKIGTSNLPKVCLSAQDQQFVRGLSLQTEEILLPDFYNSADGRGALVASLNRYVEHVFCSVDTSQLLQEEYFTNFLSSLNAHNDIWPRKGPESTTGPS